MDVKPANFLLRVESESPSVNSARSASAPSPSAAAAATGTSSKSSTAPAPASVGVAGQVDSGSAAALAAALRLGVVAIDYGDHFDLAALSGDVDQYAQQCSPTSASFKPPGQRLLQFTRGFTPSFVVSWATNADAHNARIALGQQSITFACSLTHSARLCCALFALSTGCRIHWPFGCKDC